MAESSPTRPVFGNTRETDSPIVPDPSDLTLHHMRPEISGRETTITETLDTGRLIRMAWDPKKDAYFDIEAPEGLVVRYSKRLKPRVTGGGRRLWRHFQTVTSPDPRIIVGDIAWEKDDRGEWRPVFHPDFLKTIREEGLG